MRASSRTTSKPRVSVGRDVQCRKGSSTATATGDEPTDAQQHRQAGDQDESGRHALPPPKVRNEPTMRTVFITMSTVRDASTNASAVAIAPSGSQ